MTGVLRRTRYVPILIVAAGLCVGVGLVMATADKPLKGAPDWTSSGEWQFGWWAAFGVAASGDVDNDGHSDLVVGAPWHNHGSTIPGAGKVYLFLWDDVNQELSQTWTWTDEANAQEWFGTPVLGDFNGDGDLDLAVGAPGPWNGGNPGPESNGNVYIYYGTGLSTVFPPDPDQTISSPGSQPGAPEQFGWSLASASVTGDDSGPDGFVDLIVGAYGYSQDPYWALGRAYVFHGGLGGLPATPSWTTTGDSLLEQRGGSVDSAGDVNGDGFDEIIIGAQGEDQIRGAAYLWYGGQDHDQDPLTPRQLGNPMQPDWSAFGEKSGDKFGAVVAPAGDVDGNGYDDVIIGAYTFDTATKAEAGKAYLYLSSAGVLPPPPPGSPQPYTPADWSATGCDEGAWFGIDVASAGDVDNDGNSDILVGAHGLENGTGRAYLYLGGSAGPSPRHDWCSAGDSQEGSAFGWVVASAGDVDDDGRDEVYVAAPYYDHPGPNGQPGDGDDVPVAGKGYVFFPGFDCTEVLTAPGPLTTPSWTDMGTERHHHFGLSVASAGDVNCDSFDDILVGRPGIWGEPNGPLGAAFVYHGGASGVSNPPAWSDERPGPADPDCDATHDLYGTSVALAGDVNGDGFPDIIVGAPREGHSNPCNEAGRAYLYYGDCTGISATPGWIQDGEDVVLGGTYYPEFGISVSSAGDVNGDGYDDVVIGAALDFGVGTGKAYVYHGSPAGLLPNYSWPDPFNPVDGSTVYPSASGPGSNFGFSVASADVNADAYSDIIIGGPSYDTGGNGSQGAAFVFYGSAGGIVTPPPFQHHDAWFSSGDNQQGAQFGRAVAAAGFFNNDAFADVIVGAPHYDDTLQSQGRVYIFHGGPTGLTFGNWSQVGEGSSDLLGWAVACAGDVDQDCLDDVIVGAPHWQNAQGDQLGRAYIFLGGSASGSAAAWVVDGEEEFSNFGIAVGAAGDVNGDCIPDVIVGADGHDEFNNPPLYHYGKAFVFQGAPP